MKSNARYEILFVILIPNNYVNFEFYRLFSLHRLTWSLLQFHIVGSANNIILTVEKIETQSG